jgi:hypothetical protein
MGPNFDPGPATDFSGAISITRIRAAAVLLPKSNEEKQNG